MTLVDGVPIALPVAMKARAIDQLLLAVGVRAHRLGLGARLGVLGLALRLRSKRVTTIYYGFDDKKIW